ncbi:MAG: hypothetical protein AAFV69_00365 [Pseudomonadota bacterium]
MTRITHFEIAAMRDESALSHDGNTEFVTIRPVRPGETPNLWSVLARLDHGGCEIIRDETSRAKAMSFARRFRRKLENAEKTANLSPDKRDIRMRSAGEKEEAGK